MLTYLKERASTVWLALGGASVGFCAHPCPEHATVAVCGIAGLLAVVLGKRVLKFRRQKAEE